MNHIEALIQPGTSWCGSELISGSPDFYYKSVDQVVVASIIPNSTPPCPLCIAICLTHLKKFEVSND